MNPVRQELHEIRRKNVLKFVQGNAEPAVFLKIMKVQENMADKRFR